MYGNSYNSTTAASTANLSAMSEATSAINPLPTSRTHYRRCVLQRSIWNVEQRECNFAAQFSQQYFATFGHGMKRYALFLAFCSVALSTALLSAQTAHSTTSETATVSAETAPADTGGLTWSPTGLMFYPLRAATLEARVGSMYQFGDDKLRLDIGNSLDLTSVYLGEHTELRSGADFFTYTRLRSEGRFKFPVETTDFYFGINFSIKHQYSPESNVLSGRLRVAHISSHISDGYNGDQEPFVYSREFIDATAAYQIGALRVYAGANILFSSIPDNFGEVSPQLGFDVSQPLSPQWTLTGGYDFRLVNISGATTAVHAAQAGIKLGERYGRGIVLSAYAYSGKSLHGMFYDLTDSYMGVGFQVDL